MPVAASLLASLLAVVSASGCFNAGVYPRSGRVGDSGDWSAGVQLTVFSFGAGQLGSGERANSGHRASGYWVGSGFYWLFYPLVNGQAFVRHAVADGAEIGCYFGVQEIALEARVALLDREEEAAALALAAAFRHVNGNGEPWLRTGFDYSRETGVIEPRTGLHLTWGAEPRFARVGTRHGFSARNELRVQVPLAVDFGPAELRSVAGVVAYAVLLPGSRLLAPVENDVDDRWGFHVVVGGETR